MDKFKKEQFKLKLTDEELQAIEDEALERQEEATFEEMLDLDKLLRGI